jgi:hypothetical protein
VIGFGVGSGPLQDVDDAVAVAVAVEPPLVRVQTAESPFDTPVTVNALLLLSAANDVGGVPLGVTLLSAPIGTFTVPGPGFV